MMNKLSGVSQLYSIPLFFLLIAFSVLILMPVQDEIDLFMENLKRQTIQSIEEEMGRELRYEKISPSILLSLDIHDVRVGPFDEQKTDNVRIGRLDRKSVV